MLVGLYWRRRAHERSLAVGEDRSWLSMGWHTFEKAEIDYMSTRCPYCGSVKQRASMVVHIGGGR